MRECISKLNTIDPEKAVSKKERLLLIKHKTRLDKFFCGVQTMQLKPELLIIVGQQEELIAVNESRKLNIPNITIVDTNCNPNLATYFIPGNDDSFFSIQLLLKILVNAYNTTFEEVFPFDEN
jgi:small subunit ribosomal protein S2